MYWSLSSDNKDKGRYEIGCLIDHAHALVDLGHAWRAVLKDNPAAIRGRGRRRKRKEDTPWFTYVLPRQTRACSPLDNALHLTLERAKTVR